MQSGLEFILRHFKEPLFPRKVSASDIDRAQYEMSSITKTMQYFKDAKWVNCRVSAFGLYQKNPNLIFIELDAKDFKSERALKLALATTLKNIKQKLDGRPTVLWSDRGYHILPIDCPIPLEQIMELRDLDSEPSNKFLQFAESYLSNNKHDKSHHPALASCQLRIPGSLNARCKAARIDPEVKIIQRWDGYRPDFKLLIGSFSAYLVGKRGKFQQQYVTQLSENAASIPWIEKILTDTPIDDYRKLTVDLILSRYLINVRKLDYDKAYAMIWQWLEKCAQLNRLEPSRSYFDRYVVEQQLKISIESERLPMRLDTMKSDYPDLYKKLNSG